MFKLNQQLPFDEWLNTVKGLAGQDWGYFNEWYSWQNAYDEALTPLQAYRDCKEWMNS